MLLLALLAAQEVDLSRHDPASGVRLERRGQVLRAAWEADGKAHAADFDLSGGPLLASLEAGGAVLARAVRPVYEVTVGSRTEKANERYIFFDKPALRPRKRHAAALELKSVRAESAGRRTSLRFAELTAGPFRGELVVTIYAGSPLLHLEAAMGIEEKLVAYIYDFVLEGDFARLAWRSNADDRFVRETPSEGPRPVGVRRRVIYAESDAGSVGVFPPPHAFFFPRDHTDNFKFAQAGKGRFGLRQDPDQRNAYVPWFDAPSGRVQRMHAFVQLHAGKAEDALARLERYTNGDVFPSIDGRLTFSSHWHVRLTIAELAGKPNAPEVVKVFGDLGVDLVHLAEFHGDRGAHKPADPGEQRLPELKAMFDVCRKYSNEKVLLIPGEEANMQLNEPPPPGTHRGHWVYLFPKPVYLTLVRAPGKPFVEELAPYGKVYRPGNEAEMAEVLRLEKALAWTAHPRIKASFACPDAYREKEWFKSDTWLGGAWKAMPGDLSHPRLGVRVLDLLDDMNTWGRPKICHGEVDTFELDRTHELYAHMNVNYLRLAKRPTVDDWSPVLDVLRRGDFFVSTGEVLIHDFRAAEGAVVADLQWTFPLSIVELAWWDGTAVKHRTIRLDQTQEFGRAAFSFPLPELKDARWVRLEAWDAAVNGAFTQPLWLR